MVTLIQHSQGSALGAYVKLYQLDLTTKFNEPSFFFTEGHEGSNQTATFGTQVYSPFDVAADGFDTNTEGSLARPTFAVSNLSGVFTSLMVAHGDLLGATLTRIRTWDRFLDDGDSPDTTARYPDDVYVLNKKTRDDDVIQWELVAAIDVEGVSLPGRPMVKDYCDHTVRQWNGSAFVLTNATCPWGSESGQEQAYDAEGNATTDAAEVFSKRANTCCVPRFGISAELPFRGFLGMSRIRAR